MKTATANYSKNVSFTDAKGQTVFIEIEVKDGRLSICGNIAGRGAGQCQDSISPADDNQRELIEIWNTFHLNDMHAGTPDQERALKSKERIDYLVEQIGGAFTGSPYEKQANDFLKKHGITFSAKFKECEKYFQDDQEERDVFKCTFRRGKDHFSVRFGQSLNQTTGGGANLPTAYDVLACLTKSDPEDLKTFCDNFGYSDDSISARRIYKSVCKEWAKVNAFFTAEELEELQNI